MLSNTGLKDTRSTQDIAPAATIKMSDGIVRIQPNGTYDFDAAKLSFRDPKAMTSGAKLVMLNYDNNQFLIETPTMLAPMGKMEYDNPGAATKHTVMLSLTDMDSRPDMQQFQKLLESIDEKVRSTGFERSMAWFRKTYKTQETVNEMYTPLERRSKNKDTGEEDGRWPPSVKLTLPYGPDGKPKFTAYNERQEEIDINSVEMRHANVTAIVCLQNVWMAGNMFGVSFKAVQLMVQPKRTMAACAFRNVAISAPGARGPAIAGAMAPEAALVDDSEDEADCDAGDV